MTEKELKTAFEKGTQVKCQTSEEYDKLAKLLEERGYRWPNGDEKPTEWSPFKQEKHTSVFIQQLGTDVIWYVSRAPEKFVDFSEVELERRAKRGRVYD